MALPDETLADAAASVLPLDTIIHGDALDVLRGLPDACVDAVITDPPAGIAFMGKDWDRNRGGRDAWIAWLTEIMGECLRVLKPGGHALVWALPRTSHWTATALEDAGFEVRDCITHLFGSGFPKSLDVSKQIDKAMGAERRVIGTVADFARDGYKRNPSRHRSRPTNQVPDGDRWALPVTAAAPDTARAWTGWGTALKPAAEFWWLCRKPLDRATPTVAANVLRHGTGAINIAASRVGYASDTDKVHALAGDAFRSKDVGGWRRPWMDDAARVIRVNMEAKERAQAGRWPPNLVFSHAVACTERVCAEGCPVRELDAQSGVQIARTRARRGIAPGLFGLGGDQGLQVQYRDVGTASRFFPRFRYVAKASRSERNRGCEGLPESANRINAPRVCEGENFSPSQNHHPTVKPLALMQWLCRLITPPGGIVLDPFAGSGTTCVAARQEGMRFIGVEREAEYVAIARARTGEASSVPVLPPTRAKKSRRKSEPAVLPITLWDA